ncbi:MAG: sugar ABC transporter substrate-binding protein [Firmicutes bacterium]|nr:sugar ABC transporter substrate-binding protein [Bacillota bacterium]
MRQRVYTGAHFRRGVISVTLAFLGILLWLTLTGTVLAAAKRSIVFYTYERHNLKYWQKKVKEFNKENPGVEVKINSVVAGNYPEIVNLMFNVGNPPDLFMGGSLPIAELIKRNQLIPLDELAPDRKTFQAWKARFPEEEVPWVEGTNVFNGKVYSFPWEGSSAHLVTYYNRTLFRKAGLNPDRGPTSWAELREYARKVTTAGKGSFYGITMGIKRPEVWDYQLQLAYASGWRYFDWRTGRFAFDNPIIREFVQLFKDMKAEGSIFPGELSNDEPEMKMNFALDRGAFYFGGPWDITVFPGYYPKVDFDVILPPSKTGKMTGYYTRGPLAQGRYYVSRSTNHPEVVWKFIEFITSADFWEDYVRGGYGVSPFPEFSKPEYFENPLLAKLADLGSVPKIGPESYWSPNQAAAWRRAFDVIEAVHPDLWETVQGIYVGKAAFGALTEVDRKQNEAWDKALAVARSEGSKVTRADFTYPDWDPTKNYVPKQK